MSRIIEEKRIVEAMDPWLAGTYASLHEAQRLRSRTVKLKSLVMHDVSVNQSVSICVKVLRVSEPIIV